MLTLAIMLFLKISLISLMTLGAQLLSDASFSPQEKFLAGQKISGVFSSWNPLMCSQKAANKYIPDRLPEQVTLNALVTVGGQTQTINQILDFALQALNQVGDLAVKNRHICTSFYIELDSHIGNALSYSNGYIIFDYKIIDYLYRLPNSSFWVLDYLVLHEFAHQLQYWNNDIEVQKTSQGLQTSRVPELTADCMAGYMLTQKYGGLPPDMLAVGFRGVQEAAKALGDFKKLSPSHHGTPDERIKASNFGFMMASQFPNQISAFALESCNQFVKNSLK